jgi:hypothetical protein
MAASVELDYELVVDLGVAAGAEGAGVALLESVEAAFGSDFVSDFFSDLASGLFSAPEVSDFESDPLLDELPFPA